MANIVLNELTKRFGSQMAVSKLSLSIKDREFIAILGPSGCGKTTIMNMIAGLLEPDEGTISFNGKDMAGVAPGKRGIGFVFQNYAIFGHMTAYDNVAYGLKIKKIADHIIKKEVKEVAELLQIGHCLQSKASSLSLNDMQKVALGRSMITKPSIFLLDEPLSNLDAGLRNIMRAELKNIQREVGQTSIYVTHDQIEAMGLADRIAIMNVAELQQFDTPHMVYNYPKNLFVASFIGNPSMNLFKGVYHSGKLILDNFHNAKISITHKNQAEINRRLKQESIVVGIRPEHVKIVSGDIHNGHSMKARVAAVEPVGARTVIYLNPAANGAVTENIVKSSMPNICKPATGDIFNLEVEEKSIYLFDKISGNLFMRL